VVKWVAKVVWRFECNTVVIDVKWLRSMEMRELEGYARRRPGRIMSRKI